ncbi:DNA repair protein RecO [Effusibacillus lacus]|uniref:DNA repair protein RecO n=1 Tax=Effusibacillus lacus TaxID=1348429 RepID=A0A292YRG2_9BACL|nr:DNA repair protein RecO [Effusibacillus lacus]TCS70355.1 DNA replication and repair protein RecO [Effusibacillus lacus]GAX91509.1 DNA repair protein RecO [Effusibacillus lacus]
MDKTEGIVLRAINYGETNKVVTLLTAKYGKVAVLAKGANKPQSRLVPVSQPFVHGTWLLYGGNTGMFSVSHADLLNSFRPIREDLFLSAYAACMTEITDRVLEERQAYPGSFHLLLQMLGYLVEGKDPEVLLRIYESKMFFVAGIQPNLARCGNCGNMLQSSVRFSIQAGGPLCDQCRETDPYAVWMKPATFKLLRLFQEIDVSRLGSINVGNDVKQQLGKIHKQYLEEHAGIHLKSKQFLDQLHKYGL